MPHPTFTLCIVLAGLLVGGLKCNDAQSPRDASAPPAESVDVFIDRAEALGLGFVHFNGMSGERYFAEMTGAGGAFFDYDNDGDLDVYLVQGHMLGDDKTLSEALVPPADASKLSDRLYRNEFIESGTMRFTDVTQAAELHAAGYGMGVAVGDMNNDSYADLYVTNFGSNQMFRNNGDGTFEDITESSGTDDPRWSTSATFFDYDLDGLLDLFVGNYVDFTLNSHKTCYSATGIADYCGPLSYSPYPDRLFRNNGDGTFEDVSAASRIATEYGPALGVIAHDFNSDGLPDLYVANDGYPNQLWINQGNGRFQDDALLAGVAYNRFGKPEGSMGVDAADFDGDGDEDLFMTHIRDETHTLYVNTGPGLYEDASMESQLGSTSRNATGFGTAWLDYDNDGRLDLLVANGKVLTDYSQYQAGDPYPLHEPNQLFRNLGNGRFEDVSSTSGTVFAQSEVSRGAAFGDVDNDGDMDVLITNNNGPVRLLLNQVGNRNSWLGLRLVEAETDRDAYGARVEATLPDGRVLWRRVRADASYCSANDPRILLGLGDAAHIESLTVHWPDGRTETWEWIDHPINQYIELIQGSAPQVAPSP